MFHPLTIAILGLALTLPACSVLDTQKVDYKSAAKVPALDVPPDLTQLAKDPRYAVTGGAVSASGFRAGQASQAGTPTAFSTLGDVRIERSGSQRWLVINRPADKLWDPLRDFWKENGFLLVQDQPNLGIMETDWAENRAKIPQDFIRNSLGKLLDSLYSTGERDKFRTRLERNAEGGTEIYISHRGMVEVYSNSQKDSTVWQPRQADPELEAEFLRRLMVKLGATQEQSKTLVASPAQKLTATLTSASGQPVIELAEPIDRAWRRVGLSLDRTGFTVEDRDRSKGIYFVRYVEPSVDKSEPGLISKLFGGAKAQAAPVRHRIVLNGNTAATTVSVQTASGTNDISPTAHRILTILASDLN